MSVDAERATALCLDDAQLLALHQLALDCERIDGAARDLEFAFTGGRLFLLQARPITVAAPLQPAAAPAETGAIDRRLFTGLLLAAVLAPLNSTIIAVALPTIAVELRSSAADVTWWLVTPSAARITTARDPSAAPKPPRSITRSAKRPN